MVDQSNDKVSPFKGILSDEALAKVKEIIKTSEKEVKEGNGIARSDVLNRSDKVIDVVLKDLDAADGKEDGVIHRKTLEDKLGVIQNKFQGNQINAPVDADEKTKAYVAVAVAVEEIQTDFFNKTASQIKALPETLRVDKLTSMLSETAEALAKEIFETLDKNHDGKVTKDEIASREVPMPTPPTPLMQSPKDSDHLITPPNTPKIQTPSKKRF